MSEDDTGDLIWLKYKWTVGDSWFYAKYDENVKSFGNPNKHPHDRAMALTVAQSTDIKMTQNALYCIGALFSACNQESNLQHSNDCLRCIQVYMKFPRDGTRHEQLVRDNAVSAFGKVITVQDLLKAFIDLLPLTQDFSENKSIYDTLMRLVLEESWLIKPYITKVLWLLSNALPSETICTDKGIQQVAQTLNQENQQIIHQALPQKQ